jgi:hypothetical protein
MGHTHYWTCAVPPSQLPINKVTKALQDMRVLVIAARSRRELPVETLEETYLPLKDGKRRRLVFMRINGSLPGTRGQDFVFPPSTDYASCTTDRQPYDLVVMACLAVAKYHLGELLAIRSTGTGQEWSAAVQFVDETLRITVANAVLLRPISG